MAWKILEDKNGFVVTGILSKLFIKDKEIIEVKTKTEARNRYVLTYYPILNVESHKSLLKVWLDFPLAYFC